jgi:RHS repeat-associated protein
MVADPVTNRLKGLPYDDNGNLLSGMFGSVGYDAANRMISAAQMSGGTEYYGYGPDNKRIYRMTPGNGSNAPAEYITLYGAFGEKLGVYQIWGMGDNYNEAPYLAMQQVSKSVWFAGELIWEDGGTNGGGTYMDRLKTNHVFGATFYPYGEEITATSNDRTKFGSYTRDSFTGLDYADQRYYASTYGRFNTPDPYMASSGGTNNPAVPQSWNRYAFVLGDPANHNDRRGLYLSAEDCINDGDACANEDWGSGSIAGVAYGSPCFGNYFVATGQEGCPNYEDDSSPPPPQCSIEFGYAPAFSPYLPGKHTFFYVEDSSQQWEVVDAGPTTYPGLTLVSRPPVKIGSMPIPRPPNVQARGFGNLQTNVSPTGLYNEATNPNSVATFFSAEPCSLVSQLEQDAKALNNIVPYGTRLIGSGWYNSNSFTYTLAVELGLPIPAPTVYAPGWGNYIPH